MTKPLVRETLSLRLPTKLHRGLKTLHATTAGYRTTGGGTDTARAGEIAQGTALLLYRRRGKGMIRP